MSVPINSSTSLKIRVSDQLPHVSRKRLQLPLFFIFFDDLLSPSFRFVAMGPRADTSPNTWRGVGNAQSSVPRQRGAERLYWLPRREGLVHRMNGVSGFLACHSASARSSNASGASSSVFPHVEGFFFCEKKNSAFAAVDLLDRDNCCDHLTGAARAQPDGHSDCEPLLTIGWPVWLLIAAIVSISLGALLLLLRSRISNRKLATRHAPVAPDSRTDCDTSRFVPPPSTSLDLSLRAALDLVRERDSGPGRYQRCSPLATQFDRA